jgi:hypothetical protein
MALPLFSGASPSAGRGLPDPFKHSTEDPVAEGEHGVPGHQPEAPPGAEAGRLDKTGDGPVGNHFEFQGLTGAK